MSNRINGASLWWIRPIINGVIREDKGEPCVGSIVTAMKRANALHVKTGQQHAATEVRQ